MGLLTSITQENVSLLPEEVREEMGLRPGDRVEWVRRGDGSLGMRKAGASPEMPVAQGRRPEADADFEALRGIINVGRPVSVEDILEAIEEAHAAVGRGDPRP